MATTKKKSEVKKYSLVEELRKADDTLQGSPSLLGMSMLTYPNYINSMRSIMFTSHLRQFLNLLNPQFPLVFTNNENMVGKNSRGYKDVKHKTKIVKKIVKYEDILDNPNIYLLFVFDMKENKFDVIERTVTENLTENFGYDYINDKIDSLDEGDIVDEGEVLYRSTSYDEDMNYSYGRNPVVIYTLDPYTSEDAAICSKEFSENYKSVEYETFTMGINNNDFFINLYGDKKKGGYKPLPDIGDIVSDRFAAIRRQFNNQLLFDFKDESLNKVNDGDTIYYCDKDVQVVDYTIYDNSDEPIDNPFYEQINKYIKAQRKYYKEVLETCEALLASGYECSRDIKYLKKRAGEMLDNKKKWKDGDKTFGNMEIEVSIRRVAPISKGSKITGRFGNKSVISEIWENEDMPYTKDGRRVDLMLNLLAIINRTTSAPIYELFMTGAQYQVRQQMATFKTLEEKEEMLFDFVGIFNEKQRKKMYAKYKKRGTTYKEKYIQDAIDNGILIHWEPLWEDIPIFYRCQNCLKRFPFIKEDTLYIRKWNREIAVLSPYFVGNMYVLKLKQTDRRGFSARSTGALDQRSIPTRSQENKSHRERISTSCIRFGEYETLNFLIGIVPEDAVLFHALYRTSIKGRKDIIQLMFGDDVDGIIEGKIDKSYTSRVAEVFHVILKCLGIGLDFEDEMNDLLTIDDEIVRSHTVDGETFICTDYQAFLIKRVRQVRKEILEKYALLDTDSLTELVRKELKNSKYLTGAVEDLLETMELPDVI